MDKRVSGHRYLLPLSAEAISVKAAVGNKQLQKSRPIKWINGEKKKHMPKDCSGRGQVRGAEGIFKEESNRFTESYPKGVNSMRSLLGVVAVVCMISTGAWASEAVGALEPEKKLDLGFEQGSRILAAGILFGGSPVGVDFEYGLSSNLGVQFGIGTGGTDLGLNLHLTSDKDKDLYFSFAAAYLPVFDHLVMPVVSFGSRWYFGASANPGFTFELGSAYAFKEGSAEFMDEEYTIDKNQLLPRLALGVVFKLD